MLSDTLKAFAALAIELGANALLLQAVLTDIASGHLRALRARTAVWDGRAADVSLFVHELTPEEYEVFQAFYSALLDVDASLERALRLEVATVGDRDGLRRAIDEAEELAQQAISLGVPASEAVVATRHRLTEQALQMAEVADALYAGTDFAPEEGSEHA